MWIAIGIIGGLALLITVILSLPVYVTAKDDEQGELMLRYHFLHMTFGEEPDPENPILLFVKEASGLSRTSKEALRSNVKTSGVVVTVKDTCHILLTLLQQVVWILPRCTLTRLHFTAICTADDAGDAALNYGKTCAVAYPLLGAVHALMPVKKSGESVDICCDFDAPESEIHYDIKLRTNVCDVLIAFIKIVYKEALRTSRDMLNAPSSPQGTKKRRKRKTAKRPQASSR